MTVVFTEFAKGRLSPANHVSNAMEVDAKESGATLYSAKNVSGKASKEFQYVMLSFK